eukprot:Rhum_TRINITY_DN14325_c3_g1::Rhum_TRINITY_DN14325_c3_g1_i1::g.82804::m.82804
MRSLLSVRQMVNVELRPIRHHEGAIRIRMPLGVARVVRRGGVEGRATACDELVRITLHLLRHPLQLRDHVKRVGSRRVRLHRLRRLRTPGARRPCPAVRRAAAHARVQLARLRHARHRDPREGRVRKRRRLHGASHRRVVRGRRPLTPEAAAPARHRRPRPPVGRARARVPRRGADGGAELVALEVAADAGGALRLRLVQRLGVVHVVRHTLELAPLAVLDRHLRLLDLPALLARLRPQEAGTLPLFGQLLLLDAETLGLLQPLTLQLALLHHIKVLLQRVEHLQQLLLLQALQRHPVRLLLHLEVRLLQRVPHGPVPVPPVRHLLLVLVQRLQQPCEPVHLQMHEGHPVALLLPHRALQLPHAGQQRLLAQRVLHAPHVAARRAHPRERLHDADAPQRDLAGRGPGGLAVEKRALEGDAEAVQCTRASILNNGPGLGLQEHLRLADLTELLAERQLGEDRAALLVGAAAGGGDGAVARDEVGEGQADGVAHLADAHRFENAGGPHLGHDLLAVEAAGLLAVVRLDAADPVGVRRVDDLHELLELVLVDACNGRLPTHLVHRYCDQPSDEGVTGRPHQDLQVVLERVHVLLPPPFHVVHDSGRVVRHAERVPVDAVLHVRRVVLLGVVELRGEGEVGALDQLHLLVQQREHAHGAGDEVQGALVVLEDNRLRVDALVLALLDVPCEDVAVVVVLKLLVREVDAQLLERVVLEVLEAEDVEQPDPVAVVAVAVLMDKAVDALHKPQEHLFVQRLAHRVPLLRRTALVERRGEGVAGHAACRRRQLLEQLVAVHLQQVRRHEVQRLRVLLVQVRASVALLEHAVRKVQHGGQDVVQRHLLGLGDADDRQRVLRNGVLLGVVDAGDGRRAAGAERAVVHDAAETHAALLVRRRAADELVEGVVAALARAVRDDPAALEKVRRDVRADQDAVVVELQPHELSEARRVVV